MILIDTNIFMYAAGFLRIIRSCPPGTAFTSV